MSRRKLLTVASLLVSVVATGVSCSYQSPQRPNRAEITGKVFYRGKPLTGGDITVVSKNDAGLIAGGLIEVDGTFWVPDAPVGTILICITTDSMRYGRGPKSYIKIPPKYNDYLTSGLTAEVASEGNGSIELQLN